MTRPQEPLAGRDERTISVEHLNPDRPELFHSLTVCFGDGQPGAAQCVADDQRIGGHASRPVRGVVGLESAVYGVRGLQVIAERNEGVGGLRRGHHAGWDCGGSR
jgi:hypothetical protein